MRLIDADELKERLRKQSLCCNREWLQMDLDLVIDNAPTVEVDKEFIDKIRATGNFKNGYQLAKNYYKRPQGEWIIVKDEKYGDNVKCPFCGKELAGTDLNFCCKCGAKMKGGESMPRQVIGQDR